MSQLPGMKKATTFSNIEVDTTFGESMQHLNSKAENPKSYQWNFEQIQSQGEFSVIPPHSTTPILYQQDFSLNINPLENRDPLDIHSAKHNVVFFQCRTSDPSVLEEYQLMSWALQPPYMDNLSYSNNFVTGNVLGDCHATTISSNTVHLYKNKENEEKINRITSGNIWIQDQEVGFKEKNIINLRLQGIDTELGGIRYKDDESIDYYYTTNKIEQLQVQSCSTSWEKDTVFQVSGTTKKLYLTIFGSGSGSMDILQKTIIVPSSVIQITSINLQESTLDISGCQNLRSEYFSHVTVSESPEENVIRMTQNQVDYFQRLSSPRITTDGSDYIFDGVVRVEVVENE